ncbi:MAG: glycerol-3-phosphate dehydrogenase [Spirochaetae bacterium HGW-Spirochaetae-5]|nr:MAG: glycerol-3-phosphate dehydrogenase [Spirochaetae bacterium HGW-Spirochaetae-5]
MIRSEFNSTTEYDIIVIGGGITGAAVAYDAASRGLSVALVEKDDFGSKTSSATSKLIHGGLRYLANFELSLVRESLRERRVLENIAPNFVYPIGNMIIFNNPAMKKQKYLLKIGMILYDILSFDKKFTWDKSKRLPSHKNFSRKETIKQEPVLDSKDQDGSLVYYDCASICPERLTLAFIKSAAAKGADVANYMEVKGFRIFNNKIDGVNLFDKINNRAVSVKGKITINCAGPWADKVLSLTGTEEHKEVLRRSEGIHIITKKILSKYLVTSSTPGGRHIFIIPWRGYSLIGTTDKEYIGSPDKWTIRKESVMELVNDVNSSFGENVKISYDDILYCYGGLRPLVEDQTEDVYESSRKYEIFDNAADGFDGLITVEGGKYTTSRNLAENVMKIACRKLGISDKKAGTDKEYLYGSEIEDINAFVEFCKTKYSNLPSETVDYLSRMYGTEIDSLMSAADKDKSLTTPLTSEGEIAAQIVYAIEKEMALTLTDILFRRTGLGTLGHPGKDALKKIADTAGAILGWDQDRKNSEIAEAEKLFKKP